MSSICKKHGKPRTVIYQSRPGKRGNGLEVIGCEDCAKAAKEAATLPAPFPVPNPPGNKKKAKVDKATPIKPKEPEPVSQDEKRTLAKRFGFKF